MDPTRLRDLNMVREGMQMTSYYNEMANACALDRCMEHCRQIFHWDEKYPVRDMGNGKVRAAGVAMAMQGSCISNVDVGSATIKLSEDGTYNLIIGAADMGTGCDTILAQMAAECMDCGVEDVAVFGADTDASPYDSGSYASSTTYITGKGCAPEEIVFEGRQVRRASTGETVTLEQIGYKSQVSNNIAAEATASHSSPVSPPPYMVGMVEIELDKETGQVTVLDYMAVVDCGIPINPALARIQTEGGIVQGIGHTLTENVQYDHNGRPIESSFFQYRLPTRLDMGRLRVEFEHSYEPTGPFGAKSIGEIVINTQYRLPTRLDMGRLRVEFEHSYEPTGPFGAKSIGEIVINTPAPALTHAIYRVTGVWHREIPITPEQIALSLEKDA